MKDAEILVTRSGIEAFARSLLRPGMLPLEEGRAKAWLDRTFQASISLHAWQNYLTMFLYEHREFLGESNPEAIRAMSSEWYTRQPCVPERVSHLNRMN